MVATLQVMLLGLGVVYIAGIIAILFGWEED